MKKGFYLLLSLLMMLTLSCQEKKEKKNEYNLIPLPNQMIPNEGRFDLTHQVKVIVTPDCPPQVMDIADSLITRIAVTSGIKMQLSTNNTPESDSPAIVFCLQDSLSPEAYQLSVAPGRITIAAAQPNGFFYGVQTLYQLLPPAIYGKQLQRKADWSVPAVEIEDSPRFPYRGMMLDVCRNFVSADYIYKFIDMLAQHKMNTFHWHLTDDQGWRIEIKKYPELTNKASERDSTLIDYYYTYYPQRFEAKSNGGYYTQEEIKDIVAYAASKYITVIPEIEMPGHARAAIGAYPYLSCRPDSVYPVPGTWGILEEAFCPKEETFEFLEGVIDEVVELFPGQYIHVGGDECLKNEWSNCENCQALIKKLGLKDDVTPNPIDNKLHTKEEKLQSYVITRMEKYINSKGKSIIGWDEILEGGLAPNATVMSWRGIEGGLNAAKAGHNAIMTPMPYMYLDFYQEDPETAPVTIGGYVTLKNTYLFNPVEEDAPELVKEHILGVQGNGWAEYMQTEQRRDYQLFPKLMAIAETGWTLDENKDWNSFCQRMEEEFLRMDIQQVEACRNFFDVNVNTRVVGDELLVTLECFNPSAKVYYTTDGSEPTTKSLLYTEPFALVDGIDLKAAAFIDGKRIGNTRHKPLYGNLVSGKKFTSTPEIGWLSGDILGFDDRLGADTVTLGLTNGKRGNGASYVPWTLFQMSENCTELVVNFDLEQPTAISKVVFGSLYNPAFRILCPSELTVEVSADGVNYHKVAQATFSRNHTENKRTAYIDELVFDTVDATYLRLIFQNGGTVTDGVDSYHDTPGKVYQASIVLDEIEVY